MLMLAGTLLAGGCAVKATTYPLRASHPASPDALEGPAAFRSDTLSIRTADEAKHSSDERSIQQQHADHGSHDASEATHRLHHGMGHKKP